MTPARQFSEADLERARTRWDVIAADLPLKRQGRELAGLCPFHNEKSPSFYVCPDKGFFHCFGCGAHGTAIDYLMRTRNLDFSAAVRELLGLPQQRPKTAPAPTAHREPAGSEDRGEHLAAILAGCGPVTDRTAAHLYLWSRHLNPRQPELFAHPALDCFETRQKLPALIAPIRAPGGEITAIQRIWCVNSLVYSSDDGLTYVDGTPAKDARAPLKARKKTLGTMGFGAVRLRPAGPVLGLAEGIETAIAAMEFERGVPVWAICGVHRLGFPGHWREAHVAAGERARLWVPPERPPTREVEVRWIDARPPGIWIPADVERLMIFGDNGEIGHIVTRHAVRWWRHRGLDAIAAYPDERFGDFNDQLIAMAGAI